MSISHMIEGTKVLAIRRTVATRRRQSREDDRPTVGRGVAWHIRRGECTERVREVGTTSWGRLQRTEYGFRIDPTHTMGLGSHCRQRCAHCKVRR